MNCDLYTKNEDINYATSTKIVLDVGKSFLIQYGRPQKEAVRSTARATGNCPLPPRADGMEVRHDGRPHLKNARADIKEVIDMICEIEIKNGAQIEKINRLAAKAPYEVWLSTDTVMLDARSLLGLMALVGKRVRVVAEDNVDPKRFARLVDRMA